jgi:hypothetical protein
LETIPHVHAMPCPYLPYDAQEIERRYDSELDLINKRQKKEMSKQESQHIQQFKAKLKTIKSQQVLPLLCVCGGGGG